MVMGFGSWDEGNAEYADMSVTIDKLNKRIKNLTVQNHQLTAAYCDLKEDFDIVDTELDRMEHAEVERLYRERESKGTSARTSKS